MWVTRDRTIQAIEKVTATATVGRRLSKSVEPACSCVLVFAAHPDDDVLGVGVTMSRHVQNGDEVRVIFTTNGGGHYRWRRDIVERANIRYNEACNALSKIQVSKDNIWCLGFPDGRLYRYMERMARDIKNIIERVRPKRVYVHSIEGGHRDHDITSFVVQRVCEHIGYSEIYEWAEYNPLHELGEPCIHFPPDPTGVQHETIRLTTTPEEAGLKYEMLLDHESQVEAMKFKEYKTSTELIRRCRLEHLELKLNHFWTYCVPSQRLRPILETFSSSINTL